MKFNDNKGFSANTKSLVVRILSIVGISLIGYLLWRYLLIPYSGKVVKAMTTNEVIASVALFVSIASIIIRFADTILHQSFTAKRKLSLSIDTAKQHAIITCKVENCSKKRIVPQNIYMMIEEGIERDNVVEFPYLLRHEQGAFDCVFATLCKGGGFTHLPEHLLEESFKGKFRKIIRLKHLSSETIMFIDPGEEFSEDVLITLKPGCYRVTVVWTSVKEDCICGTKEFFIEETGGENSG